MEYARHKAAFEIVRDAILHGKNNIKVYDNSNYELLDITLAGTFISDWKKVWSTQNNMINHRIIDADLQGETTVLSKDDAAEAAGAGCTALLNYLAVLVKPELNRAYRDYIRKRDPDPDHVIIEVFRNKARRL